MTKPPRLEPVHCPTCACSTEAAITHVVEAGIRSRGEVLAKSALKPGDRVHSCGYCRRCEVIWCVVLERRRVA